MMIVKAREAAEMVSARHPGLLTICLRSNTIEVFQCTQHLNGESVVAISYESEGFCVPVEGVLTDDAHQLISKLDAAVIHNAATEYRIAKHSLVGVELFGDKGSNEELKQFFALKCVEKHRLLADEYNILVDGSLKGSGYHHFSTMQELLGN